jgi:hypothetical protein
VFNDCRCAKRTVDATPELIVREIATKDVDIPRETMDRA